MTIYRNKDEVIAGLIKELAHCRLLHNISSGTAAQWEETEAPERLKIAQEYAITPDPGSVWDSEPMQG
jgi:hypothetical protein